MVESHSIESGPSGSGSGDAEAPLLLIPRPQFQLRSLGIRQRWEVTRRHPYYQIAWKKAGDHYRQEATSNEFERLLRQMAIVFLAAIGVSGEPPDPATLFEDLGEANLNNAWLSGAVHPITMKGLAGILIAGLPKETLSGIGELFLEAARDDEPGGAPRTHEALQVLALLGEASLDCYPDEPFVSINPAASQRQIEEALNSLLVQWKAERGLTEQRDRSDKVPDYLRVWDLREGWNDAGYDRNRELTLKCVARRLRKSIPTITNQYRQAFELIVGHPYSPDLWCRLFGVLKLGEIGQSVGRVSRRRPLSSPVRRPVPESRLLSSQAPGQSVGPLAMIADRATDLETNHLIGRIRDLIGQGRDDDQILEDLNLSVTALAAVSYLRSRTEDSL